MLSSSGKPKNKHRIVIYIACWETNILAPNSIKIFACQVHTRKGNSAEKKERKNDAKAMTPKEVGLSDDCEVNSEAFICCRFLRR